MKPLLFVVLITTAAGVKFTSGRQEIVVTRYSGALCDEDFITDIWTVPIGNSPALSACTMASHIAGSSVNTVNTRQQSSHSTPDFPQSTPESGTPDFPQSTPDFGNPGFPQSTPDVRKSAHDLPVVRVGLARVRRGYQALHLTCLDGGYALGVYTDEGDGNPVCSHEVERDKFTVAASKELAAGQCGGVTDDSASYQISHGILSLPNCYRGIVDETLAAQAIQAQERREQPGITGDPHLTNIRGEKFDIHDGLHRLVHYPRGAPKEEALFMVDARAVDMGEDKNCYSVYLDSVNISGKWVGDEISFGLHTNSSVTISNPSAFFVSFASKSMDWPTLAKRQDAHLNLKGSMPVTVTTSTREASGDAANGILGGEELTLKVGGQHPVLVQVWSSHGHNALTREQEVRYLNINVENLPANAGGIIGQDSYSRPTNAHCELVTEEQSLLDVLQNATADVSFLRLRRRLLRSGWTASASTQER